MVQCGAIDKLLPPALFHSAGIGHDGSSPSLLLMATRRLIQMKSSDTPYGLMI
jgi:hypothetical protein